MSAIWMCVRSEWRRRWGALLALGLLIALTGGVTLAIATGARRADTAIARFQRVTNFPEIEVVPRSISNANEFEARRADIPSTPELVDRIMSVPGVRGVAVMMGIAATPDPDDYYFNIADGASGGRAPRALSIDGRRADPQNPHEVVVNETATHDWDARVGETLTLHTLGQDQLDQFFDGAVGEPSGPTIDVVVVGVERDIEAITDSPEPILQATPAFLERYAGQVAAAPLVTMVTTDPMRVDESMAGVQNAVGDLFSAERPGEDFAGRVDEAVSVEVTALWVFAATAGLAGLAIVYQAISRNVSRRADDDFIGHALGLTRRDRMIGSVLRRAPALLAGLVCSVVIAVALSPLFPRGLARRAEPTSGVFLDGEVLGIGAVVTVAVVAAMAAAASWSAHRRGAARSTAPAANRLGRVANSLPPVPGLGLRFALLPGGGWTRAGWTGLTGVAIAAAGLLGVATVERSADHLLSTPRAYGAGWDARIEIERSDHDPDELVDRIAADPSVAGIARVDSLGGEGAVPVIGTEGTASVEPEAILTVTGAINPTVTAGRSPAGPGEVAIGPTVADQLGADLGDVVEVAVSGGPVSMVVVGRVIHAGNDELGNGFLVTREGLEAMVGGCPADSGDETCAIGSEGLGVAFRPGVDRAEAIARLAEIDDAFTETPLPSVVNNLTQIGSTPWLLAGFLVLLGLAGMAHAVTLSPRRDHDLAVTRALGLRPRQAAAAVRGQALVLAATGTLVGLVFGAIAGMLVWTRVAEGTGALAETVVPTWIWVAAPVSALVVALAVAGIPAARMARMRLAGDPENGVIR